MSKIKVLLADDFAPVREIWRLILSTDERIEVIGECANGQEVIDRLPQVRPDIIIMDINMSPVNGFEASYHVRSNYPEVKVLGISVHSHKDYVERLMEVGANGFIVKSARKDEMIQALLKIHSGETYIPEEFN